MQNQITRYTPSLMSQEELESIFVQRQPLLDTLFERHKNSVLTGSKHFSLLIAPRGMGKTHLVSMLNNQLKADSEVSECMMLAWLREEEWGISSYQDLLSQIIKCLQQDYGLPESTLFDQLYLMDECDAQLSLESLLLEILGDKTLLLIAENLNIIFDSIQTEGQEKLRALIQNSGKVSIVAAAQALFSGVATRKGPFYGFFSNYHLQKLSFEDALQLLKNIAARNKNDSLLEMLDTDKGRARVRALHHLASGSPRIYVMFSQFIQADNLDEFTGPVLQMLDELTPYYQAKMLELPAQQRKLVITLCREQGAITVQDLAKKCHITQQTASSQLKKLKDSGFVESSQYGRQSYYEIAEPLMRMVLSIKEQRGGAVKLAIDIIRHFFTISEMKNIVEKPEVNVLGLKILTQELLEKAISVKEPNPYITATIKSYEEAILNDNSAEANRVLRDYLCNHELSSEFFSEWNPSIEKLLSGNEFDKIISMIFSSIEDIEEFYSAKWTVCSVAITLVNQGKFKKYSKKNNHLQKYVSKLSSGDKSALFLVLITFSLKDEYLLEAIAAFELFTLGTFGVLHEILNFEEHPAESRRFLKVILQLLTKVSYLDSGALAAVVFIFRSKGVISDEQLHLVLTNENIDEFECVLLVFRFAESKDENGLRILNNLSFNKTKYLPLKMLSEAAIEYVKTNNTKHLLQLPKEYREFFEQIEGIGTNLNRESGI